jgi:hypothetical protein
MHPISKLQHIRVFANFKSIIPEGDVHNAMVSWTRFSGLMSSQKSWYSQFKMQT